MPDAGADPVETLKRRAAEHAAGYVASGMVVGLGHGSTAIWALRAIAAQLAGGGLHDVRGIPCSLAVAAEARRLGIPLTDLERHPVIDLTIDGADEVDPRLNLLKGGGGALTREKVVAQASRREVIVVDGGKLSPALGTRRPLSVEVLEFALGSERRFLESLGAAATLRMNPDRQPARTDQGHLLLDCRGGPIADPEGLARTLDARAGIVGHGLFVGLATEVLVAGPDGVRALDCRRAGEPACEPVEHSRSAGA